MRKIALSKNKIALIDDEDYPLISKYNWFVLKVGNRYYAQTTKYHNKKNKHIYMHRLIMGSPKGMDIDHINHNTLDNRRPNLRICTRSQNHFNRLKYPSASKYKGVSRIKSTGQWRARIKINRKEIHLGSFWDERDAAKVYDQAAQKYFGKYALLNFPKMKDVI